MKKLTRIAEYDILEERLREPKEIWELTKEDFQKIYIGNIDFNCVEGLRRYPTLLWYLAELELGRRPEREDIERYEAKYPYDYEYESFEKLCRDLKERLWELHRNEVDKAIREGKPVPSEVLEDYPDLVEKYGKQKAQPVEKQSQLRVTSVKNRRGRQMKFNAKIKTGRRVYMGTVNDDLLKSKDATFWSLDLANKRFHSIFAPYAIKFEVTNTISFDKLMETWHSDMTGKELYDLLDNYGFDPVWVVNEDYQEDLVTTEHKSAFIRKSISEEKKEDIGALISKYLPDKYSYCFCREVSWKDAERFWRQYSLYNLLVIPDLWNSLKVTVVETSTGEYFIEIYDDTPKWVKNIIEKTYPMASGKTMDKCCMIKKVDFDY